MAAVLFVCLHNAGRSQMSQALFERTAAARHIALSAGTIPADHVHPEVVEVMAELGALTRKERVSPRVDRHRYPRPDAGGQPVDARGGQADAAVRFGGS
jgi:protein-tyrosine-phosphatase